MELWKDILGFEGFYQISNLGQVRSLDRHIPNSRGTGTRLIKGRVLSPRKMKPYGHLLVHLVNGPKRITECVHRLVLTAFVGDCPNGMECRHLDGDPSNNQLSNLVWGTPKDNQLDRLIHGTCGSKAVQRSDGIVFHNARIAAEQTPNTHRSNITMCCLGKTKTSGGYGWKYV